MAGGAGFRVNGADDPLGLSMGEKLKDGYTIPDAGENALDIQGAGINGYGDFIIQGVGCQVIRIPDIHRTKLAAYLLSSILDTEPVLLRAHQEMTRKRAEREMQPHFRTQAPRPRTGGVVAKP